LYGGGESPRLFEVFPLENIMARVTLEVPVDAALAGKLNLLYTRTQGLRPRMIRTLIVEQVADHDTSEDAATGELIGDQTWFNVWFEVLSTRKNGRPEKLWVTDACKPDLFLPQAGNKLSEDEKKEMEREREAMMFLASAAMNWLIAYATYLRTSGGATIPPMNFSNLMLAESIPPIELNTFEYSVCRALMHKFVRYCGVRFIPMSVNVSQDSTLWSWAR